MTGQSGLVPDLLGEETIFNQANTLIDRLAVCAEETRDTDGEYIA